MLKCIRCNEQLVEHAVPNALVELKETESGYNIVKGNLLPVIPHVCQSCGYVELHIPKEQLNR